MSLLRRITRWTGWLYVAPRSFLEPHPAWLCIDLPEWSATVYAWTEDAESGLHDYVRNPWRTLVTGMGDCEDYALVALHVLAAQTSRPLWLGFCGNGLRPTHIVVSDGMNVYSSGRVYEDTSLTRYVAESPYEWVIRRRVL